MYEFRAWNETKIHRTRQHNIGAILIQQRSFCLQATDELKTPAPTDLRERESTST